MTTGDPNTRTLCGDCAEGDTRTRPGEHRCGGDCQCVPCFEWKQVKEAEA